MLSVQAIPPGGKFIEFVRINLEASDNGSAKLTFDISSSDTTINVDNTTGFPTVGIIKIDDEEMSYSGKTGSSFTGVVRGINDTVAVPHLFPTKVFMVGPFEILYTMDGSIPSIYNPITVTRMSPVKGLPIDRAKTIKFFARRVSPGTGTITSVGTAVTGSGTSFTTQLAIGNVIIANNQSRIITNITTPTALTIDKPFKPDISVGVGFRFVGVVTGISVEFYDITELTAKNAIPTVPANIKNYTLQVENGDIVRSPQGLYSVVSGVDKTKQDIREIILVENIPDGKPVGDRTLPQFGSALNRIIGQSFPASFAASEIESSIFDALSTLIELERREKVPSNEQVRRIVSVTVTPKSETDFKYNFVVETVSGVRSADSGIVIISGGS